MRSLSIARVVLLLGSLAATLSTFHALEINWARSWRDGRDRFHEGIVSGDFKAPYQHRVVAPYVAEVGARIIVPITGMEPWKAREITYILLRFVCTWLLLILFYQYATTWLSDELALAGALLFGGLHLYTFRAYYYQPSSAVHVMLMAAGVRWALRGRTGPLYPLIAVASAARETSGLIVAYFLAARWRKAGWLLHAAGLTATWLAVQVILRLALGSTDFFESRPFAENFWSTRLAWVAGLFGIVWLLPMLRFKQLPPFLRRSLILVAPPLVAANLWFGKVEETRLFLELGLILIPASFVTLFGCRDDPPEAATPA